MGSPLYLWIDKILLICLTVFPVGFQFLDGPGVMAGGVADEIGAQDTAADPGEGIFGEEFFIGEGLGQLHHILVGFGKHLFGLFQGSVLMFLPEDFIHFAVGLPVVRAGDKRCWSTRLIGVDPMQQ